jgi:hypothetical protein
MYAVTVIRPDDAHDTDMTGPVTPHRYLINYRTHGSQDDLLRVIESLASAGNRTRPPPPCDDTLAAAPT